MRARRALAVCALLALTAGCAPAAEEETAPAVQTEAPAQTEESSPPAEEPEPTSEAEPTDEAEPDDAAAVVITISDFTFVVPETVAPGTEITITNEDASFHTVTADEGAFDVGAPQGESVTFTAPDEPGEYTFHCGPHPEMVATLVVG